MAKLNERFEKYEREPFNGVVNFETGDWNSPLSNSDPKGIYQIIAMPDDGNSNPVVEAEKTRIMKERNIPEDMRWTICTSLYFSEERVN